MSTTSPDKQGRQSTIDFPLTWPSHYPNAQTFAGVSNLASKLDQIGAKWDKSGTFKGQFQ